MNAYGCRFGEWCGVVVLAMLWAQHSSGQALLRRYDRDQAKSHYDQANRLFLAGDHRAAIASYQEMLAWAPDAPPAYLNLALAHGALDQCGQALAYLQIFRALDGNVAAYPDQVRQLEARCQGHAAEALSGFGVLVVTGVTGTVRIDGVLQNAPVQGAEWVLAAGEHRLGRNESDAAMAFMIRVGTRTELELPALVPDPAAAIVTVEQRHDARPTRQRSPWFWAAAGTSAAVLAVTGIEIMRLEGTRTALADADSGSPRYVRLSQRFDEQRQWAVIGLGTGLITGGLTAWWGWHGSVDVSTHGLAISWQAGSW